MGETSVQIEEWGTRQGSSWNFFRGETDPGLLSSVKDVQYIHLCEIIFYRKVATLLFFITPCALLYYRRCFPGAYFFNSDAKGHPADSFHLPVRLHNNQAYRMC